MEEVPIIGCVTENLRRPHSPARDNDNGNDDNNINDSGGDIAHARATQVLALLP